MLAKRLGTFNSKPTPITLRTRNNILTSNLIRILDKFRHRLTTRISLPTISETQVDLMDRDIQETVVRHCIN